MVIMPDHHQLEQPTNQTNIYKHTNQQTDRQTDRKTDTQTDRQASKQTEKHACFFEDKQTNK